MRSVRERNGRTRVATQRGPRRVSRAREREACARTTNVTWCVSGAYRWIDQCGRAQRLLTGSSRSTSTASPSTRRRSRRSLRRSSPGACILPKATRHGWSARTSPRRSRTPRRPTSGRSVRTAPGPRRGCSAGCSGQRRSRPPGGWHAAAEHVRRGMGVAATTFDIPIPILPLRQQ